MERGIRERERKRARERERDTESTFGERINIQTQAGRYSEWK